MKKIALGLLVIAMFLCLTACSQDQYAKLGELMGKMSTNVYGIKPNMKDVDAATEKVDDTVQVDEKGVVTVEVKSEDAKSIVDSVIAVKDSSSKREALQESLEEPILGKYATEKQKEEVKTQLTAQATESKIDPETIPESRKDLAEAVNDALELVGSSLSENPTKAELATFATIKTLADAVKGDESGFADAGKKAIDALSITAEAAGIDLFADADITDLINNITGRDISRDGGEEDLSKWLPVVSKSVAGMIRCMTGSDGKFSVQRYNKFILECRAIKAAFEMMAKAYSVKGDIDGILSKNIDCGLTIESLGKYVMALLFVEMHDLSTDILTKEVTVVPFIGKYVDGNYDALTDLAEKYKDLKDPTADDSPYYEDLEDALITIANRIGIVTIEHQDFDKVVEEVRKAFADPLRLYGVAYNALSVTGLILVDSEYTSLLKMGDMDGTLSGLLDIITGKKGAN